MRTLNRNKGFTLIEILIVLLISSLLMTAVYSSYQTQHKVYLIQDQVSNMQQNIRAAMQFLESDIRKAGFDPFRTGTPSITTAAQNSLTFRYYDGFGAGNDLDGDGVTDELEDLTLVTITYSIQDDANDNDSLSDDLIRTRTEDGGTPEQQLVSQNIQVIDFVYLDSSGAVTTDADDVRSIEVTLVGKTNDPEEGVWTDRDYLNTTAYLNRQGVEVLPAQNDNLRRFSLTTRIRCRNMGL